MIIITHISNKDLSFQAYSLSDVNVVELLVSLRFMYDENLFLDSGSPFYVTGVKPMNQEVIATFASLDSLITQCNFSQKQLKIIDMIGKGYTHKEIEETIGDKNNNNLTKKLAHIYNCIVEQNLHNWRKTTYIHNLKLRTLHCKSCHTDLPATEEFFSPDNSLKSGLKSKCRNCRKNKPTR